LCWEKIEFSYEMVNDFMEQIKVRLNTLNAIHNLYIEYKLSYYDRENKETILNYRQELKTVSQIPITQQNDKFEFVPNQETSFNVFVLEVDEEYYKYSNSFHFEIVFSIQNHPEWLAYDINQRKVHFFGNIPNTLKDNMNFAFYLLDKETKLSSQLITFWFSVFTAEEIAFHPESKKGIIILCFLCFIFIFVTIIFLKLRDWKVYKERDKKLENSNINKEKPQINNYINTNDDFEEGNNFSKNDYVTETYQSQLKSNRNINSKKHFYICYDFNIYKKNK
jgi:hypothetical protein